MRLYTFTNMYLSQIQRGIQSAHVASDLLVKYSVHNGIEKRNTLFDWAGNHKTMIVLNGGYSSTLHVLIDLFDDPRNPHPFAAFYESEDALAGALTCVGIVLPERIYETASLIRQDPTVLSVINDTGELVSDKIHWTFNSWEAKLLPELNNYSLA